MKTRIFLLALVMLSYININGVVSADDKESYLDLLTPQDSDLGTWFCGWGNEPPEVTAKISDGGMVITGNREDCNFGSIHKKVTVDFDKYSYFEIEVTKVTDSWYIIFSIPDIKNGFIRIQNDSKRTGKFRYDLWIYPSLKWEMEINVQIGISAPKKIGQKGLQVAFKNARFVNVGSKRPARTPKLL